MFNTAIYARTFSNDTTDKLRDRWNAGTMKALADTLDGTSVMIELHSDTGMMVNGTILKVWNNGSRFSGSDAEITFLHDGSDSPIIYRLSEVGVVIVPDSKFKYAALSLYRDRITAAKFAALEAKPEYADRLDVKIRCTMFATFADVAFFVRRDDYTFAPWSNDHVRVTV